MWADLPVRAEFPALEVLAALDYRSKLDLTEDVRIVTIPGVDQCACCAPHVARTGEEPAGVEADTVAAIGEAAAGVLAQTSYLDSTFAHRDISPRNIVLETSSRSVAEQVASGSYDVRLVDLESSSIVRQEPSTFTMRNDIWRHGTPEYAAPEMLTRDVPGIEALRHSPSVDVYALCSVLYELYSGRTPYDVASKPL